MDVRDARTDVLELALLAGLGLLFGSQKNLSTVYLARADTSPGCRRLDQPLPSGGAPIFLPVARRTRRLDLPTEANALSYKRTASAVKSPQLARYFRMMELRAWNLRARLPHTGFNASVNR